MKVTVGCESSVRTYRVAGWLRGVIIKHPELRKYEIVVFPPLVRCDGLFTKTEAHRLMMEHLKREWIYG